MSSSYECSFQDRTFPLRSTITRSCTQSTQGPPLATHFNQLCALINKRIRLRAFRVGCNQCLVDA